MTRWIFPPANPDPSAWCGGMSNSQASTMPHPDTPWIGQENDRYQPCRLSIFHRRSLPPDQSSSFLALRFWFPRQNGSTVSYKKGHAAKKKWYFILFQKYHSPAMAQPLRGRRVYRDGWHLVFMGSRPRKTAIHPAERRGRKTREFSYHSHPILQMRQIVALVRTRLGPCEGTIAPPRPKDQDDWLEEHKHAGRTAMARTEEESGRLSLGQTVQAKSGASGEEPFRTKKRPCRQMEEVVPYVPCNHQRRWPSHLVADAHHKVSGFQGEPPCGKPSSIQWNAEEGKHKKLVPQKISPAMRQIVAFP